MAVMNNDEREMLKDCFVKLYDENVTITRVWTEFESITRAIRSRFADNVMDQSDIVWHKDVTKVADDVINLGVRCDRVEKKKQKKGRPKSKIKLNHEPLSSNAGQGCPKSKQRLIGVPRKVAIVNPRTKIELSPPRAKVSGPRLTLNSIQSMPMALNEQPSGPPNLQSIKRPSLEGVSGAGPPTLFHSFGFKRPSRQAIKSIDDEDDAGEEEDKVEAPRSTNSYRVYIPEESEKSLCYDESIKCPGCDTEFSGIRIDEEVIGEPEYFEHCAKLCPKYKQLLFIRSCHECSLIFIQTNMLENHQKAVHKMSEEDIADGYRTLQKRNMIKVRRFSLNNLEVPPRPAWMLERLYENRKGSKNNSMTPCLGCDLPLPVQVYYFKTKGSTSARRKTLHSVHYLIHCIQDCSKYLKLNLVTTCSTCGFKFLNKMSLISHQNKTDCLYEF